MWRVEGCRDRQQEVEDSVRGEGSKSEECRRAQKLEESLVVTTATVKARRKSSVRDGVHRPGIAKTKGCMMVRQDP